MKTNLIYIFIVLLIASCAGTKTTAPVTTPAGDWDYLVSGTPEGDFKGVLSITSSAGTYSAKMISAASEAPVSKFTYAKETNKVSGEVPYNEFMVALDATLTGDELVGSMSAGGMSFPFKATRKK